MARLAAESALVAAKVPALQIRRIQTRRVAFLRWTARLIFSSSGSLQVLLATVLLGFPARRGMSTQEHRFGSSFN
jgi:hypothetical protein